MSEEYEFKLGFTDPNLIDTISADPAIVSVAVPGTWKDSVLVTTYYDTADRILFDAGITYRIRQDGTGRVATVKSGGVIKTDGSHVRSESNVDAPEGLPGLEAFEGLDRSGLDRIVQPAELIPLFQTHIRRRSALLHTAGGGLIEFAADRCRIEADPGRKIEFYEIELELKGAEPKEAGDLVRYLTKKYRLHPEMRSKYSRGLELTR